MSWRVVIFLPIWKILAFNVDTESPIKFDSGFDSKDLFGHDLALDKGKLYVGAPKSDVIGTLFICAFDGRSLDSQASICSKQKVDGRAKNGSENLLGLKVSRLGNSVMTCAPREQWKRDYYALRSEMGTCYKSNRRGMRQMFNFQTSENDESKGLSKQYLSSPSGSSIDASWQIVSHVGTSLLLNEEGLIFNAPFARQRLPFASETGTICMKEVKENNIPLKSQIALPFWPQKGEDNLQDLTGNSIVQGRFSQKYLTGFHYAVGAPKANIYGRAYICLRCFKSGDRSRDNYVEGSEIGTRFGEVVAAADIDGNGFDDLIVAAPLFSTKRKIDAGNVYVYKISEDGFGKIQFELKTPNGLGSDSFLQPQSRFGAALSSVGDLQNDGFEDFIVGAPYAGEDHQGAIFIFRGSKDFDFFGKPQIIEPKDLGISVSKGFGYSISKDKVDIDDNGANDFAIGMPFDNQAVVLRTKESIYVDVLSVLTLNNNGQNYVDPSRSNGEFKLSLVLTAKTTKRHLNGDLIADIEVVVLDSRGRPKEANLAKMLRPGNSNIAQGVVDVIILENQNNFGVTDDSLWIEPLNVKVGIKWKLSKDCSRLDCPVLDPRSTGLEKPPIILPVNLQSGCADNERCKCDLDFKKEVKDKNLVVVGANQVLTVSLSVTNDGKEPSLDTRIEFASDVKLQKPTGINCTDTTPIDTVHFGESTPESSWECQLLPIPGKRSQQKNFEFNLEMVEFQGKDKFRIDTNLHSNCNGDRKIDKLERIEKMLKYQTKFRSTFIQQLKSKNDWQTIEDETIQFDPKQTLPLRQIYDITNGGPSPTKERTSFELFVPIFDALEIESVDGCQKDSESGLWKTGAKIQANAKNIACDEMKCQVYKCVSPQILAKNEKFTIQITMNFISGKVPEDNLVIFTHLKMDNEMVHMKTIMQSSSLGAYQAIIEYWPLLLGVGVAFLIILIFAIVMVKTGACGRLRYYKRQQEVVLKEEERRRSQFPPQL